MGVQEHFGHRTGVRGSRWLCRKQKDAVTKDKAGEGTAEPTCARLYPLC